MPKKILTSSLAFFLLLSQAKNLFCKTVTVPVTGIPKLVPYTTDITVDWDEAVFGKQSAFSYNHSIARIAAIFADNAYVDVLSDRENPLYKTYKTLGLEDSDIFFKYDVDYSDSTYGINQCAFSIASKTISSSKGKKTLVFLIIRGTPLGAEEWISNLNINNSRNASSENHEGFSRSAKQILLYLDEYIKKHDINSKDSFLLVTGHSRGASVANLCSVLLADSKKFLAENIYAYTFAAPNVTSKSVSTLNQYNFIWNIVNAEDIVPSMPPRKKNWTFQKYGNTRVLINAWNTDYEKYKNVYLPKMNFYFRQFFGKDFSPFKTGSFFPVLITKFLTSNYPDMGFFYDGFLHPHDNVVKFIEKKVFTGKTPHEQVEHVMAAIDSALSADGTFKKKLVWSCINMHTMESYLCWILALEENDVYSKMGSQIIRLQGHTNCAILNRENQVIFRIENSKPLLSSTKYPVVALSKSINTNFIGFPKNADYKIIVGSDSLLKSPFYIEVEEYSAEGLYLGSSKKKAFSANQDNLYEFTRANGEASDFPLVAKEIVLEDASKAQEKYDLRPDKKFAFHPEISWDLDNRMTAGCRIGSQQIFGTALTDFNYYRFADYISFWAGLGSQKQIYSRFYCDAEVFTKFVYVVNPKDSSKKANLVPALRLSTSFRPRSNKHIFLAGLFEFNIEDFNDSAFEDGVKRSTLPQFSLGNSVKVYPSIQMGLRF